jgi:hypothetical protein
VHFRHRSHALDVAIITAATVLFALFGLAILCAIGAITAFPVEMLLSSIGIRNQVAEGRRPAAATEAETPDGIEPQHDPDANN